MNKFVLKVLQNNFLKSSIWAVGGSVLGKGLSLIAGIIVARFLGKELYGEYGTIRTTLTYIAIVSTWGFGYSATKFVAEYTEKCPSKIKSLISFIYKFSFLTSSLLGLILLIFASPIASFINAQNLTLELRISSFTVVANALVTSQIAVLSGFKSFKVIAKNNTYSGILIFVTSIIFVMLWGLTGAITSLLVSFIYQVYLNHRSIKKCLLTYNSSQEIKKNEVKKIILFSTPIALQESLYTIVHWIILFFLISFANYGEVGISSAASMWQGIVIFVPAVLKNVMFSYLSTSTDHKTMVKNLLLFNFVFSILPVIAVIALSDFICSFYGTEFSGLKPVLIICVITSVFISLSEVYCYEFISVGNPWRVFMGRLLRDSCMFFAILLIFTYFPIKQYALVLSYVSLIVNILFLIFLYAVYEVKIGK